MNETPNDRFHSLRIACKKSQEAFGEILGLTKSGVSDIERGKRNVTEKHLIMLSNWHEYKVNIEWLRTGEGGPDNMFLHPEENDLIAKANALFGKKDPLFEALIVTYSKLTSGNKKVLLDFFTDFSDTLLKDAQKEDTPNTVTISDPRSDVTLDPRDADTLSAAVREAEEAYIKSRLSSAKKKGSSALNITDGEDKEAVNR